ncbi:MAG: hypothetical protein E6Q97_37475 [Desulfurellales bacterium]|nr:MAG: hypothetical protein E6Q97_37475 [Desulfurellales bacterium]
MERGKSMSSEGLAIILGKGKPEGEEESESEGGADEALELATSEIFDAIKDGDKTKFKTALKDAVQMCYALEE